MTNICGFPDKRTIEQEASEWIVQFEGDEPPTQRDIDALRAWMNRSPAHREVLIRFASVWNDMDLLSELKVPVQPKRQSQSREGYRLKMCLMAPFILFMAVVNRIGQTLASASGGIVAVAAVLALGVAGLMLHWSFWETGSNNTYTTDIGKSASTTLEDGSVVWLNTNSQIVVDYVKSKRRIILERGEAHFEVSHEPKRPFEVYAGSRVIRAVGTAFSVYQDKASIKVTVTEGKVDLAAIKPKLDSHPKSSGEPGYSGHNPAPQSPLSTVEDDSNQENFIEVMGSLEAGQSAEIPEGENNWTEVVVNHEQQELARRLSWREGRLVFAGETLEEVVKEVNRYTRVRIEIADPRLRTMRIGGQFQVGKTEALFDVLESGFDLKVSHLSKKHVQIHAN